MAIIDELVAILGYDVRGEAELSKFNKSLDQLEKKAAEVGRVVGTLAAAAGTAIAGGFALLGGSVIQTSAKFETYLATLETIEGSAEKAEAALDWIAEFARTTPYEVDELTAAFVKLRSYGLDPMDGSMTVLGDTAAGMGKSIDQVVEAMADASTFQFERLRELGIVASQAGDQVTFSWTENGEAMSRTIKKTSTEVTTFLNEVWGKKFGGAMIRQSTTWTGMMSNLGDSWTDFQRKIGDAGFFDTVKNKLADVMELVAQWSEDGTIQRVADTLSGAFSSAADAIGWVVGRIAEHSKFLMDNFEELKPWIQGVGIALLALAAWAFPVVAVFVGLGLAVDDVLTYLEGGESVIGSFIEWVKQLPGALMEAATAFGTWITNIDWGQLGTDAGRLLVDAIVLAIVGYVQGTQQIARWMVDAFSSIDWGGVWSGAVATWGAYVDLFYGFWEGVGQRILEILKEAFNIDLVAIGTKMGQDLLAGLVAIGDQIKAWIASVFTPPQWLLDIQSGVSGFFGPGPSTPTNPSPAAEAGAAFGAGVIKPTDVDALTSKMNGGGAAVVQDNTQNTTNTTVNAPVTVNVQQATDAPAAVGNAVGNAVNQPARYQTGGSF